MNQSKEKEQTMKEQFASYEVSKQLKELEYDGKESLAYYDMGFHLQLRDTDFENAREINPLLTYAPLWQQVKQWIWEKHKITIEVANVSTNIEGHMEWEFEITIKDEEAMMMDYLDSFKDPITAEIEGITAAVNHLHKQLPK